MNEPAVVPHTHLCWSCRDHWEHDAGDEGCVGVRDRTCPMCEDDAQPEPWYVTRRGLAA